MSDLKSILDLNAAATQGPHSVDVRDDHLGRHDSKQWMIHGLARERYGNNTVHFGEDEMTARFVAASFTVVPALVGRLQEAERILATMEDLLDHGAVISGDFSEVAADLRKALELGPRND